MGEGSGGGGKGRGGRYGWGTRPGARARQLRAPMHALTRILSEHKYRCARADNKRARVRNQRQWGFTHLGRKGRDGWAYDAEMEMTNNNGNGFMILRHPRLSPAAGAGGGG